jgi:Holliday junction resolvasome RuvABC endonuclease subunit
MIKSLKKLEKNIGKTLKKDTLCLGIDLATVTGIAFIETTPKITIETYRFKVPEVENPKENVPTILESLMWLSKDLEEKIKTYKNPYKILVIEKCYIGKNAHTALILSAFAGIIFANIYKHFEEIYFIPPTTSRKNIGLTIPPKMNRIDRKQKVMEFVKNIIEQDIDNDDEADALVYAINGLIK